MLNAFVFLVVSVALAFLIGQVSKTSGMISAIANAVVLGMCFLGGVYVPIEFMGTTMGTVAKFFPTYWYVQSVQSAANHTTMASSTAPIFEGMGLQLIFAAALMCVALVVAKQKQRIN